MLSKPWCSEIRRNILLLVLISVSGQLYAQDYPDPSGSFTAPLIGANKIVYGFYDGESARAYSGANSTYLQWGHLTHVVDFSFSLQPNGQIISGNINGSPILPRTNVINSAISNGVKPIMCVTCFSTSTLGTVLIGGVDNPICQTAINSILATMKAGHYQGVNIDFENLEKADSDVPAGFVSFITGLANLIYSQNPTNPTYQIFVDGPAAANSTYDSVYSFNAIAQLVDGWIDMGYAFSGSFSSTTGPNAPLPGIFGQQSISSGIDYYLNNANVPPSSLILACPYFGNNFTASTTIAGQDTFSSSSTQAGANVTDLPRVSNGVTIISPDTFHSPWYSSSENLAVNGILVDRFVNDDGTTESVTFSNVQAVTNFDGVPFNSDTPWLDYVDPYTGSNHQIWYDCSVHKISSGSVVASMRGFPPRVLSTSWNFSSVS